MGLVLAACGLTAPDMKAYQGGDIADSQLAIVWNWGSCPFCVRSIEKDGFVYFDEGRDGLRKRIRLAPGVYQITYGYTPSVRGTLEMFFTIELEAGHTYEPKYDSCFLWSCDGMQPHMYYVWFEDITTGRVVDGYKP